MDLLRIRRLAQELQATIPFISGINSPSDYREALLLMEALIEDYDANSLLIDVLWPKIQAYEDTAEEFQDFNARLKSMSSGDSIP